MNSRERVLRTMNHECEGRIPFTFAACNSMAVHGEKLLNLLKRYQCDFFDSDSLSIPDKKDLEGKMKYTDRWGCRWESLNPLIAGAVTYSPLANWDNFATYKMPEVPQVTCEMIEDVKRTKERYPVWTGVEQFFQVMQNIRGSEELFMDFYTQPEEVRKLIDRMLNEYHLPAIEEQLKLEPDLIGTGDDWGTQDQLLINPELWDEFFKPVYRKMVDLCHQGGAKVYFHTCGYTMEVLERLIDVGVDVVNPQMAIMDAKEYGDIARDKITISPDLNRQEILVNGSPEEVEAHILAMYKHLGTPSGGLIGYAPIEPGMPLENIEAMLKTISNYVVK